MRKLLIGLVATVAIAGAVIASNVDTYQLCDTALQVTFKNGTDLYIDTHNHIIDVY